MNQHQFHFEFKMLGNEVRKRYTSDSAVAYASPFSWPETVKNAGFPKKSCKMN